MDTPGTYEVKSTGTPRKGDTYRINPSTYFVIVDEEGNTRLAIEIQSESGVTLQAFIDRDEIERGTKLGYIVKV